MNILIVPSWYPNASRPLAGIFIRRFVEALVSAGHDVAVAYADDVDCTESVTSEGGSLVVRLDAGYRRSPSAVGKVVGVAAPLLLAPALAERADEILSAEGFVPDVVHVHALWPAGALGGALAERFDVPLVVTEHSEEYMPGTDRALTRVPGMVRFVLRPLARRAAVYTAPSDALASRLAQLELMPAASPTVSVIPNVVPDRRPHPRPAHGPDQPARLLSVSGLGPAKDIPLLLWAAALLRERRTDFIIDLAGDGPDRDVLERLAAELDVTPFVNFMGALSPTQVNAALDACSAAVISSRYETFSVFAAEALMAGRPVVTTRCGGPEEFVTPQVGVVVESHDNAALAAALDYMLDHGHEYDPSVLSAYAAARFAPAAVVAAFIDRYQEAIGARS